MLLDASVAGAPSFHAYQALEFFEAEVGLETVGNTSKLIKTT